MLRVYELCKRKMTSGNTEKKILLDADVIIHFCAAGSFLLLSKLYPNRLFVLPQVANELRKHQTFQPNICQLTEIDSYLNL